MSIFDLVGKVWKKKFGKPEEKSLHDQYMERRLYAEELAMSHGLEFKAAYRTPVRDLISSMGHEDASTFHAYRNKMEELFPKLTQDQQRHWSLARDEKDLFSGL